MNSIDAHSVLATRAASDVSVTRAPSGPATGPNRKRFLQPRELLQ